MDVDGRNPVWLRARPASQRWSVTPRTLSKWARAGRIRSLVLPGTTGQRVHRLYDITSLDHRVPSSSPVDDDAEERGSTATDSVIYARTQAGLLPPSVRPACRRLHAQAAGRPRAPGRGAPRRAPRGRRLRPHRHCQRHQLPSPGSRAASGPRVCGTCTPRARARGRRRPARVRGPPRPTLPLRVRSHRRRPPTLRGRNPRGFTRPDGLHPRR